MSLSSRVLVISSLPSSSRWLLERLLAFDAAQVEAQIAAAGPEVAILPAGIEGYNTRLTARDLVELIDSIPEPVYVPTVEHAVIPRRINPFPLSGSMDFLPNPERRWTLIGQNKRREPRTKSTKKRKSARRNRK
ncbi:hypothetical protein CPT_Sonora_077 [Stenotrophomonas phage Sonora]|nr:hypothetical protein CPT_Sonora_077 [Stenotrophomonas phage Sonora]